jgi:hypothetical protein
MGRCYEQIARLKRWKRESRSDFFPAWDHQGQEPLGSRQAVNDRLKSITQPNPVTAR